MGIPKKLSKHLVVAAMKYYNISFEELQQRILDTTEEINKDWYNRKDDETFYKTTEWQVFGHIGFNNPDRIQTLIYPIRYATRLKILDWGGGIGEVGMTLQQLGHDVYYYDLPGKTQDFAKFLSKHTNRPIKFLTKEEVEKEKFDLIITADVLEHLRDPVGQIKKLYERLVDAPGCGHFLTTGLAFSSGEHIPMHLVENYSHQQEFYDFLNDNMIMRFFEMTQNEQIFFYTKKPEGEYSKK